MLNPQIAADNIRRRMNAKHLIPCVIALTLLAFISGCEELETAQQTTTNAIRAAIVPHPTGYWNGDNVPGSPKIVIHLSEQKAYFYKGKHLVGESAASTGKPGFGTPPG